MPPRKDAEAVENNLKPSGADEIDAIIERQRQQFNREREDIFNQQQQLEARLQEINKKLAAVNAYEAVLQGRPIPDDSGGTRGRATRKSGTGTGHQRAPRGEFRGKVLNAVKDAGPDGISRAELLGKFGAKGNKSSEQQVSNACNALRKAGQIDNRDGRWVAA